MTEQILDQSLPKVLTNHEWRIKRLEELPIGCKFPDDFIVVTDEPPENPGCGICYIVAGEDACIVGEDCDEADCSGCIEGGGR